MSENTNNPFKEGQQVQHKTGGPVMIYLGVDDTGRAICSWMAKDNHQKKLFHLAEIQAYEPPDYSSITSGRF